MAKGATVKSTGKLAVRCWNVAEIRITTLYRTIGKNKEKRKLFHRSARDKRRTLTNVPAPTNLPAFVVWAYYASHKFIHKRWHFYNTTHKKFDFYHCLHFVGSSSLDLTSSGRLVMVGQREDSLIMGEGRQLLVKWRHRIWEVTTGRRGAVAAQAAVDGDESRFFIERRNEWQKEMTRRRWRQWFEAVSDGGGELMVAISRLRSATEACGRTEGLRL